MTRFRPAGRTYVRSTAGWWRKNPRFIRYMIREGSAVLVSLYAVVLLVGLVSLTLGKGAFDAWRTVLTTPVSVGFHSVAALFVAYHSLTWFRVMPKTMPDLPVSPRLITAGGIVASVVLSMLIL